MKRYLGAIGVKVALIVFLFPALSVWAKPSQPSVLIFGKTIRAIPHGKILPVAGPALANFLSQSGMKAVFTQDPAVFTEARLKSHDTIVLLDVSEAVLAVDQKAAIEAFFESGRGLVAVHASIAAGKDWPWLENLLGTSFVDHAPIQEGVVRRAGSGDPVTARLPSRWKQFDEWFNFSSLVSAPAEVVLLSDEATYQGGKMGASHPIAWKRAEGKGRFFYTAMGHPPELYTSGNSPFLRLLRSAVRWAAEARL